jgi:uncharacterized protein (DUF362 family)
LKPRPVAIRRAEPDKESVFRAVQEAMESTSWRDHLVKGEPVSLKPNLGWDKLVPGAISAPWVVDAVVRVIKGHASRIYVVESDQVVLRSEDALRVSGIDRVVAEHGLTYVNMSHSGFERIDDPTRLALKRVHIPEILRRTQLVTLPVLKTHNKTTITGALKNQWGCLQSLRHNFHLVLPEALVDVNTHTKPVYAVMDGTVGLEGNGPKSGTSKEVGVVLASADPVGIDACAARIMGFDPSHIAHLTLAEQHGLGTIDPPLAEGSLAPEGLSRPFVPAKHNAVSRAELALRRPGVEYLVFHTPVLRAMTFTTRRYYDVWDALVGRRQRRAFFRDSPWAAQWPDGP